MFVSDREKIGKIPESLGRMVRSYRFALAAFLIPVFIRSIPEILVGPYPIGWDTIAFYVPNTRLGHRKNRLHRDLCRALEYEFNKTLQSVARVS
jgi:hypothetical protein